VRVLCAVAVLALAAPGLAPAHERGGVMRDATAALAQGVSFVDSDASPTLGELDADRLRRRLETTDREIRVAVLPAEASEEVAAGTVAGELDRRGTVIASVGGRIQVASADIDAHRTEAIRRAAVAAHPSSELYATLDDLVTRIDAEPARAPRKRNWPAIALATLLSVVAAVLLVRRRARDGR